MAEAPRVELYGVAMSSFCKVVECALKLKGVPYDYIEEDLQNKSEALLKLNPVHKKVPVLVVDGRPLAESLIITRFIDEVWKEPPLLPSDPYRRAKLLFWVDFVFQKMGPLTYTILGSVGDTQKKAAEEYAEQMAILEDGVREELWSGAGPFINGENPGILDLIMGTGRTGLRCIAELAGAGLMADERTPLLCSSMDAFLELDALEDLLIPKDELMKRLLGIRQKLLASTQA